MRWLTQFVEHTLISPVERDHRQTERMFRRRRVVAGVTLVVGATLLGLSMATEPGDMAFYALTLALALTWVVGAFASGPLHAGRMWTGSSLDRPVLQPTLIGLAAVGVFTVGGWSSPRSRSSSRASTRCWSTPGTGPCRSSS